MDRHRFAYGRRVRRLDRRFIVFGTSNEVDCLPADMNDNRRYLPIALLPGMPKLEIAKWFDANRDQLWAEAMQMQADGMPHYLPDSGEIREQHQTAVDRHRGGAFTATYLADKVLARLESDMTAGWGSSTTMARTTCCLTTCLRLRWSSAT